MATAYHRLDLIRVTPDQLLHAARFYAASKGTKFCVGKAKECRDLAYDLEDFGCFNSPAQAHRAQKLVAWTLPRRELDI